MGNTLSVNPENPNVMTLDYLLKLWIVATTTNRQEDIETYVIEGVSVFGTSLWALQELGLIHGGEEGGSWITRHIHASITEWLDERVYTIEQTQKLGIDYPNIKKLTEGIPVDTLIANNKKRVHALVEGV